MLDFLDAKLFSKFALAAVIMQPISTVSVADRLVTEYGLFGAIFSTIVSFIFVITVLHAIIRRKSMIAAVVWVLVSAAALIKALIDGFEGDYRQIPYLIGLITILVESACAYLIVKAVVLRQFLSTRSGTS